MTPRDTVRLAAVSDIHFGRTPMGVLHTLFAQIVEAADVLLLCGDLTDTGNPEEGRGLAHELAAVRIPMVGVLGNHDYECDRLDELKQALHEGGIRILDGDADEILGIGFAGVKGFAGGFGRGALGPWGEPAIKAFVQEALSEALKFEKALAKLRTPSKVALLHYAPISATVEGEPLEIYPYLGSGRLEEPLSRYPVDMVFHGHAHHGAPEGRTRDGIPVYNVSMALLQRAWPARPPFRVVELPAPASAPPPATAAA
ncbi:MAG TPA: metallophosphoesterase [Gemmatimonadales bacterium]|jgi:Icc-related predicted phosphoesterase|nr:metallophosphoesterase [Gemmatimonadales bacterium]